MSEQELDELFKNASEKYDAPYDPNDWEKLAVRLDKEESRSGFWNWKTYLGLSTLLLVSSTSLFIMLNNSGDTKTTNDFAKKSVGDSMVAAHTGVKVEENAKVIVPLPLNLLQNSESKNSGSVKNQNKNNGEKLSSKKRNTSIAIEQPNNTNEIKPEGKNLTSKNKEHALSATDEINYSSVKKSGTSIPKKNENDQNREESFSENEFILTDHKKSEDISLKHDDEKLMNENNSQQSSNKTNLLLSTNLMIDSLSETKRIDSAKAVVDSVAPTDTVKVITQEEEKKKERIHHISLKLNVSPDYSSVGYYSPNKSGFNFGLIGEYSFTSHWSVLSGAIWTKKNYSGNDIAYPYKGKMITANHFDGNCRMLDWPINVNYYFTPTNRLGIYVSAGLSSYFMFNQNYNYEVNYGGSEYYRSEEINQKENEWFKMTNLSFGLQYKLNNRWSLQAEPFAKIPLAGVGQGKLKLVSSGIFFNIKYTFK